ncbi:MAG: glucosyltransferase domain-containing protein [Clostridium sp.]|jgi:hypothetical protein|nr:glucosyltransferase domain-containing protein [Clostridium sp.]
MKSPEECRRLVQESFRMEGKTAFAAVAVTGLLIHLPMMVRDIPNHDGLASMHFDQNMLTSGRWFLMAACGVSSYYTLPWLIGLLALLYLSLTGVVLTEFLGLRRKSSIILVGGLLAAFPAAASLFAYVYTMDGYMLGLFLAVLAVFLTRKYPLGFVGGGVCLAFSLGIYQAYLPFAALLSLYGMVMLVMEGGGGLVKKSLRYVWMGGIGMALYVGILWILLNIQDKELASYQGISGMEAWAGGTLAQKSAPARVASVYRDFVSFTFKGNVLFRNAPSVCAFALLALLAAAAWLNWRKRKPWRKKLGVFLPLSVLAAMVPVAANLALLVSPGLSYHLLMRYQWVLFPILLIAFAERYGEPPGAGERAETAKACVEDGAAKGGRASLRAWLLLLGGAVLVFHYAVTDQIAYSNLQKRYEKTYAYALRLLDRIEQTPGYYQGIPVAMVGVVGEDSYPVTDITLPVTANMIGMNGDSLLYTGANYREFLKHYLGASLHILPPEAMADIYYSQEYVEMGSFPAADSTKVVEGILYVKTENADRE